MTFDNPNEAELWVRVITAATHAGSHIDEAVVKADRAVVEMRERVPQVRTPPGGIIHQGGPAV